LFNCLFFFRQYAQWTQRGYYPDDPHKENQDEYRVQNPFTNSDRDAMLAVYDGHGKQGHACARYAKKHLGKCVEKQVRLARVKKYKETLQAAGSKEAKVFDPHKWPLLNADEYKVCCEKAFAECNQQMHASPDVSRVVAKEESSLVSVDSLRSCDRPTTN
jgi:serine/threonine protein phosphatase PrpC